MTENNQTPIKTQVSEAAQTVTAKKPQPNGEASVFDTPPKTGFARPTWGRAPRAGDNYPGAEL